MFFVRPWRFGPLGIAFTAYRLWRRLSPAQKAAIRSRLAGLGARVSRERTPPAPAPRPSPPPPPRPAPLAPDDLTSPGTVADPDLERRRAEEALVRERESRASTETKFEELRREQEAERQELAAAIDEPPPAPERSDDS